MRIAEGASTQLVGQPDDGTLTHYLARFDATTGARTHLHRFNTSCEGNGAFGSMRMIPDLCGNIYAFTYDPEFTCPPTPDYTSRKFGPDGNEL